MVSGINKMGMSMARGTISLILYDVHESENPWVPLPNIVELLRSQFVHYSVRLSGPAKEAGISPLGIGQFSVDEVAACAENALSGEESEELRSRGSKGFTVDEVTKLLLMQGMRNDLYVKREVEGVEEYSTQVNARI